MPDIPSLSRLFEALELAAEKHRLQRRSGYDGLPYINHIIKVTHVLWEVAGERDEDILLAAVLHDLIEDTDVTEAFLAERFNPKVASIVAELSDDMSLTTQERQRIQLESADKLSREARIIRVVDKGCNLIDIMSYPVAWPLEKKQDYLKHTLKIVDRTSGLRPELDHWFDDVARQAWNRFRLPLPFPEASTT